MGSLAYKKFTFSFEIVSANMKPAAIVFLVAGTTLSVVKLADL